MDNLEFELHKVKKEIQRHGEEYTFYRRDKNEFGEPIGEEHEVKILKGLYHEEIGFVKLETDDGANIKSKPESQILCIIEYEKVGEDTDDSEPEDEVEAEVTVNRIKANVERTLKEQPNLPEVVIPPDDESNEGSDPSDSEPTFSLEVIQGDYVKIRGLTYKVVNVTDVQKYGIIANISLDLVV